MISDSAEKLEILKNLKKDGFVVEMDDFGSGYSSLNMLKDTPVDLIKIDMVFLKDMQNQVRSTTILSNVINMMSELGLESIVEGVETQEQFRILTGMGGKLFQGYLFAKPLPVEEFEKQFLSTT
jgi:EAL domain-containing protein (putative c-di-GMP-specific phosphodiesterase class I)